MHLLRRHASPLRLLFALSPLAAGCGGDFAGTYEGPATEGGSINITVQGSGAKAKNEVGPRKQDGQTVTVAKEGDKLVVSFGSCKLEGKPASAETALVKNECTVKLGAWEGALPLSGTLTRSGAKGLKLEVVGNHENGGTNVSYTYSFQGDRK